MSTLPDELLADLEGLSEGEEDEQQNENSPQTSSIALHAGAKRKASDAGMSEDEEADNEEEESGGRDKESGGRDIGSLVLEGGVKPAEELDVEDMHDVDLGNIEDVSKIAKLDGSKRMMDILKEAQEYQNSPSTAEAMSLPPLTVPDPPSSQNGLYNGSSHSLHPMTPTDSPTSSHYALPHYSNSSGPYAYSEHTHWNSAQNQSHSSNGPSLSSLLNPSSGQSRPTPTINTSYSSSPFSALPLAAEHSASSLSPDSRPPTGYSSVSSMHYDDHQLHDYSRPGSAHHRPASPARPHSSSNKVGYNNSLRVGRSRGHSQVVHPYPRVCDHDPTSSSTTSSSTRPCTSPQAVNNNSDHPSVNIPRVRSMIQLPSVDQYHLGGSQHQQQNQTSHFPYSIDVGHGTTSGGGGGGWNHRPIRSSTSTSSISAASHASSSQAHTPDTYTATGDADIHRYSSDYSYVPMNEHLPSHYTKPIATSTISAASHASSSQAHSIEREEKELKHGNSG